MRLKIREIEAKSVSSGWGSMYDSVFEKAEALKAGDYLLISSCRPCTRFSIYNHMHRRKIKNRFFLVTNRYTPGATRMWVAIAKGRATNESVRNIRSQVEGTPVLKRNR